MSNTGTFRQKTRLLLDEILSAVNEGFRSESAHAQRAIALQQLEERLLMSASPAVVAADAAEAISIAEPPATQSEAIVDGEQASDQIDQTAAAESAAIELVVIDPAADDHEQLVADLEGQSTRRFEILVLNPREDGILQITEALAERENVGAIHLVSHGEDAKSCWEQACSRSEASTTILSNWLGGGSI